MAKLNEKQLKSMVRGLKLVITKVKHSDVKVFEMQDCRKCILGTLFDREYSTSPSINFKASFYNNFDYHITMDSSFDSITLSRLQKELRSIFFPTRFTDNSVSKDEWLKVAKKLLKRLEKKLASRS